MRTIPKPPDPVRARLLSAAHDLERQATWLRQLANGETPDTAGPWCSKCGATYNCGSCGPCDYSLRDSTLEQETMRIRTRETVFQREDGSWGWYDETWNEGDLIHYRTKEEAAGAQAMYCDHVLGR